MSPAEASFYFYNRLSLFTSMMYNYESVYSFYKSAGYLQFLERV